MRGILTQIADRPKCSDCSKNWAAICGKPKQDGSRYYRSTCTGCFNFRKYGRRNATKKQWHKPGMAYKRFKKDYCESCDFKAKDLCQLDVDHVDGNHKNNDPSNLKTLCANCHRLKTKMAKENHSSQWRLA